MAAFAQMERDLISERTKAGLAAARARGRKGGRPKLPREKIDHALKLYKAEQYTLSQIEKMSGISKATVYRYLKKEQKEKEQCKAN